MKKHKLGAFHLGGLRRREMKRLLLITLLAIISSAPALAQSNAESEVLKLNKEYEEAIARRDATVHERLLAHDYTYSPGNGNIMGREEHMNFTKKGGLVIESLRSEDVRVRVYIDTVIVTGLFVTTGSLRGQESTERRIRYIRVYIKRGGRWQIVAEQRTGVAVQKH